MSVGKSLNDIMSDESVFSLLNNNVSEKFNFAKDKLPALKWMSGTEQQDIKGFDKTQEVYVILTEDYDNTLGSDIVINDKIVIANDINIVYSSTLSSHTYIIGANDISARGNAGHIFDAHGVNIGDNIGIIDYVIGGASEITTNTGTIYRVKSTSDNITETFNTTNNGVIAEVEIHNQSIDMDSTYINSIFDNPTGDNTTYIATTTPINGEENIRELTSFDPVNIMRYNLRQPDVFYHTYDLANVFYSVMNSDATYSMPQLRWTLKLSIFNNDIESKYYWLPDNIQDNIDFTVDSNRIITVKSGKGLIYALLYNKQFEKIVLGNDIDLSGKSMLHYNIVLYTPFDGQGYTIKNMSIAYDNSSIVGLIRVINGITFENVIFENGYVYSNAGRYNGIIGVISNGAVVQNIANDNVTIISPNGLTSGLVGLSTNSTIQYSYVVSQRKLDDYYVSNLFGANIGSIAGVVENSTINQVYSRFMNVPSFRGMTGNNKFTAVHSLFSGESFGTSINTLRTDDLGFDWNYVWARDDSISQPRNDGFPILQFQYAYWIEIGKEAVRDTDYGISGNNIGIITEKGLAWLSYITSSQEAFYEANTGLSNISLSGCTVHLSKPAFDMSGALWSPIGMAQGFAGRMLGSGYVIYNLHITGSYMLNTNPPNIGENTENLNSNLAFVQHLNGGILVDIVFENVVVNGKDNLAVVVSTMSGGQINGTDVINSTITGTGSNISACVAKLDNTFTNKVASCSISNTNILITGTGSEHIGGVVGYSSYMSTNVKSYIHNTTLINVNITAKSSAKNIGGILGGGQLQNIYRSNINDLNIQATSGEYVGMIAGIFTGKDSSSEINQNYITSSTLTASSGKTNNGGLVGAAKTVVLGENILIDSTLSSCAQIIGQVTSGVAVFNFYSSGTTNTVPYAEGEPSLQSLVLGPNFGSSANAENFVGAVNTSDYAVMYYNSWWDVYRDTTSLVSSIVYKPKSLSSGNANINVSALGTIINGKTWLNIQNRVQLRYLEVPKFSLKLPQNIAIDGITSNMLGKSVYPFSGTLNGGNNTITLNISSGDGMTLLELVKDSVPKTDNEYLGLFGNTKNLTISNTNFDVKNNLTIQAQRQITPKTSPYKHVSPIVAYNKNSATTPVLSNCSVTMDGMIENKTTSSMAIGSVLGTCDISSPGFVIRSTPLENVTIDILGIINNKADRTGLYIGTFYNKRELTNVGGGTTITEAYFGGGYSTYYSSMLDTNILTKDKYDKLEAIPADTEYGRIFVDDYFKTNVITDSGQNPNSSSEITFDFDTNSKVAYLKFGQSLTLDSPAANAAWYTYSSKIGTSNSVTVSASNYNIRVYQVKDSQKQSLPYVYYQGQIKPHYTYTTQITIWPGCLLSEVIPSGIKVDVAITTTRTTYLASKNETIQGQYQYVLQIEDQPYSSQTHKYKADYYQFGRSGEFVYNGNTYTGIPYYMYGTNSSAQIRGNFSPTYSLTPSAIYFVYSTSISIVNPFYVEFHGITLDGSNYASTELLCVNVTDSTHYTPSVAGFRNTNFDYWYFTYRGDIYKSSDADVGTLGALINKAHYTFGITKPIIYAVYTDAISDQLL